MEMLCRRKRWSQERIYKLFVPDPDNAADDDRQHRRHGSTGNYTSGVMNEADTSFFSFFGTEDSREQLDLGTTLWFMQ